VPLPVSGNARQLSFPNDLIAAKHMSCLCLIQIGFQVAMTYEAAAVGWFGSEEPSENASVFAVRVCPPMDIAQECESEHLRTLQRGIGSRW